MARTSLGRTIIAVMASYLALAILVGATETLLSSLGRNQGAFPLSYFVIDLISQCVYTVAAGYLCHAIARSPQPIALAGLMGMGLLAGTVSLLTSWNAEPPWYGIGLLVTYAPCVWIGWKLRNWKSESPPRGRLGPG